MKKIPLDQLRLVFELNYNPKTQPQTIKEKQG